MLKRFLLFVGLLSMLSGAGPIFAESNLTLPTDNFNFGFAPQNASLTHRFWLYSSGQDTLKITGVKPGCGCTKAPLEKDVLRAGDSTMLEIIYNSGHSVGAINKATNITTNAPQPNYRVAIAANILSNPDSTYPIIIKPYKLDISQFGEKVRKDMKFSIVNVSDADLELSVIACPEDLFEVTLPKKIKVGQSAEGLLKIRTEKLSDEFQKSFTIALNDKSNTRFTIPVKRSIRVLSSSTTQ
jgi:hypothetical protein